MVLIYVKFFKNSRKTIVKSALQRISRPNVLRPNRGAPSKFQREGSKKNLDPALGSRSRKFYWGGWNFELGWMLTKYKNIRPEKDVKGPLRNIFMSAAYSEFFQWGGTKFLHIFKRIFFERIFLKHIENKIGCGRSGGVLPLKIFKNLLTVVTILVLFEQFLRNFCFKAGFGGKKYSKNSWNGFQLTEQRWSDRGIRFG